MKLVIRFLLLLCFLLFSGDSYLHTHSHLSAGALSFRPAQSGPKKHHSKLKATEVEEEDVDQNSFRKYVDVSNFFTSFYCALTYLDLNRTSNKRLLSGRCFFHSSPDKYIVNRVFRI